MTDIPAHAWCVAFAGERLVAPAPPAAPLFRCDAFPALLEAATAVLTAGELHGQPVVAVALPEDIHLPDGLTRTGLRALFPTLDPSDFSALGTAAQLLTWHRNHRFCGRCGAETVASEAHRARECPACGLLHFPRISPAVIVRVTRNDRILLARQPRWPEGMFSVLAGFNEPGESLEMTIMREIREEVGIEVADIRYFASQSWPFPHSMMIGFTARWAGGELRIDDDEIVAADWFSRERLPRLPHPLSIARHLIDDWLEGSGRSQPDHPTP